MATLKNTTINDTGFLQLPKGTTAQRPGSPATGYTRYNTDYNKPEFWNGSIWTVLGYPYPYLYYDEGTYASAYTGNWNNATTYSMNQFGGLGYVNAHGHQASTNFTLTLNNLPPHNTIRYRVYWHCVDSLDNETSYLYCTNSSGTETEKFRFTKVYNVDGYSAVVVDTGVRHNWSGSQSYSYAPWSGASIDGFINIDTGYYAHTGSSFSARHYIGADQGADDEAMYLSHVQVWLGI